MSKNYYRILVEHEIVRRYVLINSFDGALTVLGIIFAEFFAQISDPRSVIIPTIGAAIAMFISGLWGAYSAEHAEVKRSIREIESHMLKDLSDTSFSKAREGMAWIIGFVDGFSPLLVSLVVIFPFFLAALRFISMRVAYYSSLLLIGVVLFALGAFAGRIARESMVKHGLIMLFAGIVIGCVFLVLAFFNIL